MSQILDLSNLGSMQQVVETHPDTAFEDVEAGGYICKICNAILVNTDDKKNIRLELDIAEGPHKDYFTRLEERAGFWGLTGYASFKDNQLGRFTKICTSFGLSNPGFVFDPFRKGGADIDTLIGKQIGVVIGKEEYMSNKGDVREKNVVTNITEVAKIREKKFTVPKTKKLAEDKKITGNEDFMTIPEGSEETPFN
jgi:hypothetical protein